MRQNGHVAEYTGRYDQTRADYDRAPVKPVLDGEPIYEDHPVSFNAKELGHSIAADVRRAVLLGLCLGGACGHTYGHHSVWQMWAPGREPINNPLMPWTEAIDQPGARQMQHGAAAPRVAAVPDARPRRHRDRGGPRGHVRARRRSLSLRRHARREGRYAMVYAPVGRPFTRADGDDPRRRGQSLVVQPARRQGRERSARSPTRASARSRLPIPARCSTGCWCSTPRRRASRPRAEAEARRPWAALLDLDLAAAPPARSRGLGGRLLLHALELPLAQQDHALEHLAAQLAGLLAVEARLLEDLGDQAAGFFEPLPVPPLRRSALLLSEGNPQALALEGGAQQPARGERARQHHVAALVVHLDHQLVTPGEDLDPVLLREGRLR